MELRDVKCLKYKVAEGAAVILPPFLLFILAYYEVPFTALLSCLILVAALFPFFAEFEDSRPRPRDMVPIAVMSAIAALGRVLFAAVPSFTPSSAVVLITGISLGPEAGLLTGALSALASNMALGQGPWTPWQMYAWGMIGFIGGSLHRAGCFKRRWILYIFGMLSGILFGWFMNLQYLIGYVKPITLGAVLTSFGASAVMDVTHGASVVLFLLLLYKPWCKKLDRLKKKYGICEKMYADKGKEAQDAEEIYRV